MPVEGEGKGGEEDIQPQGDEEPGATTHGKIVQRIDKFGKSKLAGRVLDGVRIRVGACGWRWECVQDGGAGRWKGVRDSGRESVPDPDGRRGHGRRHTGRKSLMNVGLTVRA